MTVPTRPSEIDVSRRQLLATTGTVASAGGLIAVLGSRPTQAAVTTQQLSIPDATHEGENGSVADLPLQVSGTYQFSVNRADALQLRLEVASPGNTDYQAVDSLDRTPQSTAGQGEYALSGSLLDHDALTADMFSADAEETVEQNVPVRVVLDVLADGSSVVTAVAKTTATVAVTNTSVEATAAVTGDGTVTIEV